MKTQTSDTEFLLHQRRSIRAFLPQRLSGDILETVFEQAGRAPSNCNTQPWVTRVVSGAVLESLRTELPERFMAGDVSLDFPYEGKYDGIYKQRQYEAAAALYGAQGIERGDKSAREASFLRNFEFFGAPHVAFVFMPSHFGLREAADVGMYVQSVLLAMTALGVGACPQTALGFMANPIRSALGVDDSEKLLLGISFGYPDTDAAINQCHTTRASLDETVKFYD